MTSEFERNLEKYAEVIVKVGANLQPGQRLMIDSPPEAYPLIRQIVKAAYLAGAKYVAVNWYDDELQRFRVQHAPVETFGEFDAWFTDALVEYLDHGDPIMHVDARNPALMSGVDAQKVQAWQQSEGLHKRKLRSKIVASVAPWPMVSAPITSWAVKVFPEAAVDEAVARLWDAIFQACRINQDDPVGGWKRHNAELKKRAAYLNGRRYAALKYSAPGTELTVGLPDSNIWHGGSLMAQTGIEFVNNIPTEEVHTMPHKDRIDGVVTSTMPLSYGGNLIENFTLKFSAGKVVEATAKTGQDTLDNILNTDPASRSLGEVALVPHSSPISQSGLVFYNTLFDENASDHLALGNAYRFSIEGGEGMTAEEFAAAGGNVSLSHVDFMIGSRVMNIDGITADDAVEPVMRNGEWAFDV